ncbi:MAG TPA: polysaccharide deacetylase family protein [Candidatus Ozemobacteraceae bacterium]|nr:polysaccharide deacetylase family protein [Candidatus Ozemobacteraceae bacterium]
MEPTADALQLRRAHLTKAILYHILLALFLFAGAIFGFMNGWSSSRAEILIAPTFHGVTGSPTRPWEITWDGLSDWISRLSNHGYSPLDPASFPAWLSGEISGGRRYLLTFDDGLVTSADAIRRLHKERGIRSVLFVTTEFIGQPGYLTWDALNALASETGCLVGLHGLRHIEPPKLLKEGGDLLAETLKAKQDLETHLGTDVSWYAYPFGEYDTASRNAIASAGLKFGFTIDGDDIKRTADPLLFPRVMYLKGVETAGGPSLADWTPPKGATTGSLHITLALFVGLMGLRSVMRLVMLRRALASLS